MESLFLITNELHRSATFTPEFHLLQGLPGGSVVKNLPANAGDVGSIPGSGRSPGGGNGNPLKYSCLGSLMDRGTWWAAVHRVAKKLATTEHMQKSWLLLSIYTPTPNPYLIP